MCQFVKRFLASICPKHWQLPKVTTNNDALATAENRTFYKLLNSYGWTYARNDNGGIGYTTWASEEVDYNVLLNPFYLTRTSYITTSYPNWFIDRPGVFAFYWSKSIPYPASPQGNPGFMGIVYESNGNLFGTAATTTGRGNGQSLRCLTQ